MCGVSRPSLQWGECCGLIFEVKRNYDCSQGVNSMKWIEIQWIGEIHMEHCGHFFFSLWMEFLFMCTIDWMEVELTSALYWRKCADLRFGVRAVLLENRLWNHVGIWMALDMFFSPSSFSTEMATEVVYKSRSLEMALLSLEPCRYLSRAPSELRCASLFTPNANVGADF